MDYKDEWTGKSVLDGCYDCGSTLWGAHTPLCAFRVPENAYIGEKHGTQHWNENPRLLSRREALYQIKRDAVRYKGVVTFRS